MFDAITALIFPGDYTPWFNTIGIAEDHPIIDAILTALGY